MAEKKSKKRRRGWWWKIPLGLILVLVVLLVVVVLNLSTIATRVANKMLPDVLGTEASVEKIEVKLRQGLASIEGVKIAQPDGFGDGQAVELGRIMAKIDVHSLKSAEGILVEAIELEGLTLNVTKDAEGVINLAQLGPPPAQGGEDLSTSPGTMGKESESVPETETTETASADEAADQPFPGLRLARVAISDIAVNYLDHTTGETPTEISLGNLAVDLTDGAVDLADGPVIRLAEGTVTLEDIHMAQPAGVDADNRLIEISLGNLAVALTETMVELAEGPAVRLAEGTVTLAEIHITQPSGFGEDALLHLPSVQLDIGKEPFVNNVVKLDRLTLDGLTAHIIRNTNSVMNVAMLGGGPPPEPAAGEEGETGEAGDEGETDAADEMVEAEGEATGGEGDDAETEAGSPVGIYLGELALTDFAVTYSDAALAKQPMDFVISDLGLRVKDLMVFMENPPVEASTIQLDAKLGQGDLPSALLTLLAKVGPIGTGVPDLNAQAKLSGLMLDTVGPLVPPGVREAIGANGLGLDLGLALTEESIDLTGTAVTDKGHDYPVRVRGPLSKPEIELGIFSAVAGRLTGGALNLAGGTAGAALDVAGGVGGGAVDLAKGAGGTVGKMGGGLFKSAKAALTLNLDEVGDGLKEATVDAAKEAGDAVQEAGDNVVDTAQEGMGSVKGDKATKKWLDGIQDEGRHAADIAAARADLEAMPFPPPGLEPK